MLNTVKIYRADVSSVNPSSEQKGQRSKRHLNDFFRCSTYPHQLSMSWYNSLFHSLRRRRSTLVLTGTSFPLYTEYNSLPQSILVVVVKWRHHANALLEPANLTMVWLYLQSDRPHTANLAASLCGSVDCLPVYSFSLGRGRRAASHRRHPRFSRPRGLLVSSGIRYALLKLLRVQFNHHRFYEI